MSHTIAQAIKYVAFAGKPVTPENVSRYLDEPITQEVLDQYHSRMAAKPSAPPVEPVAESVVPLATPDPTIPELQRHVMEAQLRLRNAAERQRELRVRIAAAIHRWYASLGGTVTAEQNVRQFIAASNEARLLRSQGKLPTRPGRQHRSAIDRTAAAMNFGSGAGGGNSFRRVVRLPDGQWVRPVDVHGVRGR